jgi:GT2 family glycosyltransferase
MNPFERKIKMMDFDHNTIKKVDWVSGAYMMLRRKVIETTALFDPDIFMYYEDTELCKRAGKLGYNTYYFPRSAIYHFHGQSSKKNLARSIVYSFKGSVIYYSKHHNRLFSCLYGKFIICAWYLFEYFLALLCFFVPSAKLIKKKRLFADCISEYKMYNAQNTSH